MTKILNKEKVEAIRIRFNKYIDPKSIPYFDLMELCDTLNVLLEQNATLKESLFNVEQAVPEEKKWENILAEKLGRAISFSKKEYLEITNSINNNAYVITIQKKFGKTPEQSLHQSEIRRLKASKKIVNLSKEIRDLQAVNKKFNDELNIFKKIYNSKEILAESKEELSRIVTAVNGLVNNYNAGFNQQAIKDLHTSVKDSFHEAWSRAFDAELTLKRVTFNLKKIKGEVLKKKYPLCRIYKKHNKRGKF